MAFFSRKKKLNNRQKGGVFNPTKTEVYKKEYDNLFEALNGELGFNSKDLKIITISYTDRDVVFYANSDFVINVLDPNFKFSLGDRAYWSTDLTDEEREEIVKNSKFNDLFNYRELKELIKDEDLEELNIIFNKAAIANTLELVNTFSKEFPVVTEIVFDEGTHKKFNDLNFLKSNVENLSKQVNNLVKRTEEYTLSLGIDKVDYKDITFILLEPSEEVRTYNDAERVIISAIENEATLEDVRKIADGFAWDTDILESILELKDRGVIDLVYPGKMLLELPELDTLPDSEGKELTIEAFKSELMIYLKDFDFYGGQEEKVFIDLIDRNTELETDAFALTNEINILKKDYFKNRREYEDNKADRVFDLADETKPEIYSIDQLSENLSLQNDSNEKFDAIAKLEKTRQNYDIERKEILNKILDLAKTQESLTMNEFNSLINKRIEDIENTENVTLEYEDPVLKEFEKKTIEEYFTREENEEHGEYSYIEVSKEDIDETQESLEDLFQEDVISFDKEVEEEEAKETEEEQEAISEIIPPVEIDLDNSLIYKQLMKKYNI